MLQKLNNFQQRFWLGIASVLFIALTILYSHISPLDYFFVFVVALVQGVALLEYYSLASKEKYSIFSLIGLGFSFAYIALRFLTLEVPSLSYLSEALLFIFIATTFVCHFGYIHRAIYNLAVTVFGPLYITLPMSFLLDLNFLIKGLGPTATSFWVAYLLITTKMTDTSAYFVGKKLGKKLLVPVLSPKKTIEGAIGGFLGAVFSSVLFFAILRSYGFVNAEFLTFFEVVFLGALIGIMAQIGDLAESLLKRDANVKDSNRLPGFGGMLDMIDSLIFTTPLLYFYLKAKNLL